MGREAGEGTPRKVEQSFPNGRRHHASLPCGDPLPHRLARRARASRRRWVRAWRRCGRRTTPLHRCVRALELQAGGGTAVCNRSGQCDRVGYANCNQQPTNQQCMRLLPTQQELVLLERFLRQNVAAAAQLAQVGARACACGDWLGRLALFSLPSWMLPLLHLHPPSPTSHT